MWPTERVFVYQGELLAITSALFWAVAVILFRLTGRSVRPLNLNLFKIILCSGLFVITSLALREPLLPDVPLKTYGILLLSGVIGIGVSDTLYFASLNRLGAGLSAIVNCTYSPLVIVLATVFLGERMSLLQVLGVCLIIGAVLTIARGNHTAPEKRRDLNIGIGLGMAAMLAMAVSIILMKPYLSEVPVVWATLVRTIGGLILLGGVFGLRSDRRSYTREILDRKNWKLLVSSSIFGGYLAYWAWMGGMKFTQASTAAALNQMSTVFIFILAVVLLREKATTGKLLALVLAVGGVLLVTFT
jgi:uncharacterized membrane protein